MSKATKVFWIVMGVILILGGIAVFNNPFSAFLYTEALVGIILMTIGVLSIVVYIATHKMILGGGWILAEGIIALVIGLMLTFGRYNEQIFSFILAFFIGFWLLSSGIMQITRSVELKKLQAKGWAWSAFWGALCVISGALSFMQPLYTSVMTTALFTGAILILSGISMISKSFIRDIEQ